jgi:hypothetical protein
VSGTVYDDPNREALGLAPIWTGAGEARGKKKTAKDDEDDAPPPAPKATAKK